MSGVKSVEVVWACVEDRGWWQASSVSGPTKEVMREEIEKRERCSVWDYRCEMCSVVCVCRCVVRWQRRCGGRDEPEPSPVCRCCSSVIETSQRSERRCVNACVQVGTCATTAVQRGRNI